MFYPSTPDLPHQRSRLPATCPLPEMEGGTANVTGDNLGQTSSRKRATQNADLFIHDEVLVEILARLPVRSLLRFKCVCKTWFSLIGSQYFAEKHLSVRSMMFKDYNFENLMVDHCGTRDCLQFSVVDFDTLSVVHRKFKIISSREYSNNQCYLNCSFVGSCNGIVCLLVQDLVESFTSQQSQQSLLLWNPATGEVKALQHEKQTHVVGFGFDPKMNDYKVVLIRYETIEHVSVYSLGSDSWKSFDRPQGPEFYRFVWSYTTRSGGRMLDWLGIRGPVDNRHHRDEIVISFDLSVEAFLMTPMPPGTECKCGRKHKICRLVQNTFDEPCTIVCFPDPVKIDDERECVGNENIIHIWILNEYGESGSWTKLRSVVMFDYVCHDVLALSKGGEEVLFEIKQPNHKPQLASYNPITQQLRFFGIKSWPCLGYTESLISIHRRYGGVEKLLLDDPNIDDFRQKQNYYSLVDDSTTGRTIYQFHMATFLDLFD
ncbi:hypothetical protein Dimus_032453 [Dionaea muscipula]